MGEKRWVKIDSHVSFFCILDPFVIVLLKCLCYNKMRMA